ncbi:MAG: bactofilin [Alicyclobacillus sp.]|nr:bactofilin [Alicyclobacillus sp.]
MEGNVAQDLNLAGIGSASGGTYQNVDVQGIAKIHGDVECVNCHMEGVSEIAGHVKAIKVNMNGKAKVLGDVVAEHIEVEGATRITGTCRAAGSLMIRGSSTIGGVSAHKLTLDGVMRVKGACEAETFNGKGGFRIDGLLNADTIQMEICRDSSVNEIGCERIRVEHALSSKLFQRSRRLTVQTIEGDEIYLESTKAKTVRGNQVTLGPGTEVDVVEYKTAFLVLGNAWVGESKQV